MRAVFDTNILVSALAIPGGRADEAVLMAVEGRVRLLISKPIIGELLGVLSRKFSRDPEELARAAVYLSELGEMVHPRTRVAVLADKPDNRILECAVDGSADVIVTGDRAMLSLGSFRGIRIISLSKFLEIVY